MSDVIAGSSMDCDMFRTRQCGESWLHIITTSAQTTDFEHMPGDLTVEQG